MKDWQLRPARDHGLAQGERLRSLSREPGLGGRATSSLWRMTTRGFLSLAYRLTVEGRDNLPAEPPFVLIGNHTSHLDALTLAAALPASLAGRAFALAAGDTFFTSDATAAFAAYAINALPIWRKHTSADDLATLRRRLTEDRCVLILFPEGTRSRTGELGRFRPGIGALVAGTAVPVVPCHLRGAFEAWPPSGRFPRPGRLRLRIGPPLSFADIAPGRGGTIEVAARCEAAVRALAV
jgi:1-acyl-sn-glycerol-3-phosphate acyltransferase